MSRLHPAPEAHTNKAVVGLIVILLLAGGTAAYAYFVEPFQIDVTRHQLSANVSKPLKIAHLSDLHTNGFGPREQLLAKLIALEKPDVIVVTGDIVGEGRLGDAMDLFSRLSAPLGVWIVRGESDRFDLASEDGKFFEIVKAQLLANRGVALRDDIWLAGLDDASTGEPDITPALAGAPAAAYKIVLFHAPDHFTDIAGLFHLGLAGHTHGGQVHLPGYGPLWVPERGRKHVKGWFSESGSHLYVSRGLGTTNLPVRLLCAPELAMIEIRPN